MEAEASGDILLQGEISAVFGQFYFRVGEFERTDKLLKGAIHLALSHFHGHPEVHSLGWFRESYETLKIIRDDLWVKETLTHEQIREVTLQELEPVFADLRDAAQGGAVRGAHSLIKHVFQTHPAKVDHAEFKSLIEEIVALPKSKRNTDELRQVLNPMKFLYHPDKNLGLGDLRWTLLCEQISALLNDVKLKGERFCARADKFSGPPTGDRYQKCVEC